MLRPFFSRLWPLLQPFATLAGLCASCVSLLLSAAFGKFGMLRPVFLWHHFCGCGRKRPIIGQMTADGCAPREVQLYAAAHDGVFGHLYLMTLFTASGLLSAGGAVDLWGGGGWAAATPLYAFGGLFSILHCLYFLLGIESAGSLVVMLCTLIWAEFFKWLGLFVPALLAFALFFQVMSVDASSGSVALNFEAYFRTFVLAWGFDNTLKCVM